MILYYTGTPSMKHGHPESLLGMKVDVRIGFIETEAGGTRAVRRVEQIIEERRMGMHERVRSHFLDSGAFTQQTQAIKYAKETGKDRWSYYDTAEFRKYLDDYASFVKQYKDGIDLYANVDVIPNPERTWESQRYLEEEHGLKPIPVVHFPTDLKWLNHYVDRGYELIALGGLVGKSAKMECRMWIDRCFDLVCNNSRRLPVVKLHGFGITTFDLLKNYPWWSVDSVTWAKVGAYGGILVPPRLSGGFTFDRPPRLIKTSNKSKSKQEVMGESFFDVERSQEECLSICYRDVVEWLESIDIPLGKVGNDGEVIEHGVTTRHTERRAACLHYFERLRKSLPEWPWPFDSKRQPDFGFV